MVKDTKSVTFLSFLFQKKSIHKKRLGGARGTKMCLFLITRLFTYEGWASKVRSSQIDKFTGTVLWLEREGIDASAFKQEKPE